MTAKDVSQLIKDSNLRGKESQYMREIGTGPFEQCQEETADRNVLSSIVLLKSNL